MAGAIDAISIRSKQQYFIFGTLEILSEMVTQAVHCHCDLRGYLADQDI